MMSATGEWTSGRTGEPSSGRAGGRESGLTLSAAMAGVLVVLVAFAKASEPPAAEAWPRAVTSFGPITSHNGAIRGEVLEAPAAISGTGSGSRWIVRLETSSGRRLENAGVQTASIMPALDRPDAQRASAKYIGEGKYEIAAVGFDEPGWWNLGLVIRDGASTDSLAFNVIIPASRQRGAP